MSWRASEWKSSLSHDALSNVCDLENRIQQLQREVQQRNCQIENLTATQVRFKKSEDELKKDLKDQERQARGLESSLEDARREREKFQHECQVCVCVCACVRVYVCVCCCCCFSPCLNLVVFLRLFAMLRNS